MKLYRCQNPACSFAGPGCKPKEFEAALPVCPGCKVDARIPRYKNAVVELVTIHWAPPDPIFPTMILGSIGCAPARNVGGKVAATPEHRVVNCKACRALPAFVASNVDEDGEPLPADGELNAFIEVKPGGPKVVA